MAETGPTDKTTALLQAVAATLSRVFGGAGFCLLVWPRDEPGRANYVSNVQRPAMKAAMTEVLARWEGRGHDAPETKQ